MKENATQYIKDECNRDEDFKHNIELLDKYDFSKFLAHGRSLWNIREAIEEKYDKEFYEKYDMYVFDYLSGDDTCQYFMSRYNIWFQEYVDWVVRNEDGTYGKARKRSENCSGEMA